MWFLLISCALLTIAKGETRLCSTPVYSVCRNPNPYYNTIPRDVRELLDNCPSLIDHLECIHSYDVACAGRSQYTGISPPLYYGRIKSVLDGACDETSSLHSVLGRSLPCIKQRVSGSDVICHSETKTVQTAYEKYLATNPNRRIESSFEKKQCLNLITTVACMMKDIEKECGFFAFEAINTIILQTQFIPHDCGLDIFQELKDLVEDLKLSSHMKAMLRKYFVVEIE